jgi:hypothetical protein
MLCFLFRRQLDGCYAADFFELFSMGCERDFGLCHHMT